MDHSRVQEFCETGEKGKPKFATMLLALTMFFTGACGLVSEYALGAVSTYILGNSIEQMCMTIAVMMLMMAVGSWAQKWFQGKLVEKFILIELLIAVIGGFAPIAMYAAFGLLETHFLLVQYFFICSMGFLIGLEIPVVLRINAEYSETLGINVASVYSPDYIGSFVGAAVWVYYLIRHFPITEISFIVAGINLSVAVCTYGYFLKHGLVKQRSLSLGLIVLVSAALAYGYVHNREWNVTLQQHLYEDKIVFSTATKYQQLTMTYRGDIGEYRFYINGNLQFSSADESIYHEQLVHPVMSLVPDHRKVLILGGGDGMALREVLKYQDVESVTLVDLDPDMVRFCASNETLRKLNGNSFGSAKVKTLTSGAISSNGSRPIYQETGATKKKKGPRTPKPVVEKVAQVDILNLDADKFLSEINGKWNVVIVDFPDPNAIELAKLYSQEFYLKLERVLAENGMMVVQSTSPYHAKEAYLCVKRTIEAAGFQTIPYHDNVPSFGDWGWVLGWKSSIPKDVVDARLKEMRIAVETRYLTPEVFRGSMNFGKGLLLSKYTDINTLMYPTLLDKYVHEGWKID
jgi:spermidine synthase